jgi:hypothetical protein
VMRVIFSLLFAVVFHPAAQPMLNAQPVHLRSLFNIDQFIYINLKRKKEKRWKRMCHSVGRHLRTDEKEKVFPSIPRNFSLQQLMTSSFLPSPLRHITLNKHIRNNNAGIFWKNKKCFCGE